MRTLISLFFSLFLHAVIAQTASSQLKLVDLKHFTGPGDQGIEGMVAGSNGESYVMVSWETKFEYGTAINISPPKQGISENLILLKIAPDGNIDWYRRLHSATRLNYNDMLYMDSVGLIVLFKQADTAYYDYGIGNASCFAGMGDFTIVNYAHNGAVNWSQRFEADVQVNNYSPKAYLARSDSGFFVAFSHEGSFDADIKGSNIRLTGDGGGRNVSLMEYDFQLNLLRFVTWTTAETLIVEELAYNSNDQILMAFSLSGQFDADPRPGTSVPLSSPNTGWRGSFEPTYYVTAFDKTSLGVDWHQRIQATSTRSIDEVLYDQGKDWWWVVVNCAGFIQTFDSPAFTGCGGSSSNTPQSNVFHIAYDNGGTRSFTGGLCDWNISEYTTQFISAGNGYLLMALVDSYSDLDFRLNQNLSNSRNTDGLLISRYDTNLVLDWAYVRMEISTNTHGRTLHHAAQLGTDNYLFGFSPFTYNPFKSFTVGPQLDSSQMVSNIDSRDAILAQWRTCGGVDTTVSYLGGVFYAKDTTADHYEWISCFNDSVLASGPDPFWKPNERTWAYCRMVKDQCDYTSSCIIANDVGMEEWSAPLNIYPNPAHDQFTVNWQGENPLDLNLRNTQGQIVKQYRLLPGKRILSTPFSRGIYFLQDANNPAFNLKLILH